MVPFVTEPGADISTRASFVFDKDQAGLDASYDKMHAAYINIFNRCGIDAKCVEADSGAIGGSNSAEFMVRSEVGEDEIVFCSGCDYAANMEKAVAVVAEPSTEEMKELLIEKILVYSNNVLEIYWKADFIKYFSDTSRIIGKETGKNE